MRGWLLFLVITIALGLIAGTAMGFDSGYVLFSWGNYVVETSLGVAALLMILGMFTLYLLMRASLVLLGNDWRFNEWRRQRRSLRARRQTNYGLISLTQGQWRRAERQLTLSVKDSDTPLINYLAASRAAFEQGKTQVAETWLQEARENVRGADLAVNISQAHQLHARGQNEQALAILLKLHQQHPKHTYLLKMLVKLCIELEDWQALQELMPAVRKLKPFGVEQIAEMEEKMQLQLLERESHSGNSAQLKQLYHSYPRQGRQNVAVALRYAQLLSGQNNEKLLEQELREILKNTWHDDLLRLYGKVKGEDAKSQLLFAEKHLTERTNNPVLLLVLGQLALRMQDYAKAKEYLEAGLRLKNLPELHQTMAKVQIAEGNKSKACEHFQLALAAE